MDSALSNEVAQDLSPYLKIYKDGRVERLSGTDVVPTSLDPQTGVECKDAVISAETGLSARLYIPKTKITTNSTKLPLLIYYHGGGFCMGSPFCAYYHNYLTTLVAEANVVAVSVDYRKAPENPLPLGYDDSWAALGWVQSHIEGQGPEDAGANIAHHMAVRLGHEEPIEGETDVVENRARAEAIWRFAYPTTSGADDLLINPGKDAKLSKIGAKRVLVCVAEQDALRQRGWYYSDLLRKSEWGGSVEVVESKEEDHVFHLNNPVGDNAVALLKKIASFLNQDI
ncbi:carboxylesterase 12 [Pyrus ussuriensis x Pyrus communis]|uniref:Carboxylesterase 12 n=1 Tax=Pyrus ussuriensis x Pyrus communis TaxID=2448454 RepID=A0A5N5FIF6_9ROSA|nr:carboxylesterase 12 [Pyrus ussuriensis x Pyrus communis]